jgi:enoyl-[acyl-carrier protein] reductase I
LTGEIGNMAAVIPIDLKGRRAFVAGVADDVGFGFAIAKALAEAGASVCIGCWPPALGIFETLLRRGKIDESLKLSSGQPFAFEKIYAIDAAYDTLEQVPEAVKDSKRYANRGDFTIDGVGKQLVADFGEKPLDIVVHSLANGPEVKLPLVETSREGYLAALGISAYSLVSMVQRWSPILRPGGNFLSLTYIASERVIPGYGGGMSSAKAALESDTRMLAYEAGRRFGVRINTISAGPFASRAASVTGIIDDVIDYYQKNSPLPEKLTTLEVANTAAFLASPLATGITGSTVYVDKGFHAMGRAIPERER